MSDIDTTAASDDIAVPAAIIQAEMMGKEEVADLRAWEKTQTDDGAPRFSVDELANMDRAGGGEEDLIRKATDEYRRKKQGEDDPPTIEWKVKGKEPLTLEEATKAKFASRKLHVGHAQGLSVEDSLRDLVPVETLPPTKVYAVGNQGQIVPPLQDDLPIGPNQSYANLSEMRRGMQNFRDAQAAEQAALLAELQQAEGRQAVAAQAVASPPVEQPEPAPQPAPQPSQPDPLAIE